jgi:hypothetical protein
LKKKKKIISPESEYEVYQNSTIDDLNSTSIIKYANITALNFTRGSTIVDVSEDFIDNDYYEQSHDILKQSSFYKERNPTVNAPFGEIGFMVLAGILGLFSFIGMIYCCCYCCRTPKEKEKVIP